MDALKRAQGLTTRKKMSDLFCVLAEDKDQGLFFTDDFHLGKVFTCSPLVGADDGDVEMIKSLMSSELPSNSFLTFHHVSSSNVDFLINFFKNTRKNFERNRTNGLNETQRVILKELLEQKSSMLMDAKKTPLIPSTNVLLKNSMVIVCLKVPCSNSPTSDERRVVKAASESLQQSLDTLGMNPVPQSAKDYILLMRELLNMGDEPRKEFTETELIRDQLTDFDSHIKVFEKNIIVNNRSVTSLSMKSKPDSVSLAMMDRLIGDPLGGQKQVPDPYMLTTIIFFENCEKLRADIAKKKRAIDYQAGGNFARFAPRIGHKKEGFDIISDSLERGSLPVKISMNLTIFSADKDRARRTAATVKGYYQIYHFVMQEDDVFTLPAFIYNLPMQIHPEYAKTSFRFKTMTVETAAHLIPVLGEWRGPGNGACVSLISRRGQIMFWDLFDTNSNMNGVIAAESGAGKSFFANDIVIGYLQKGAKVRIIDRGGSYEKLLRLMDGQYIEFTEDAQICINPFSNVIDLEEELELLTLILSKMAFPSDRVSDWQKVQISMAIQQVFEEHGTYSTITLVAECLQRKAGYAQSLLEQGDNSPDVAKDIRLNDLTELLHPFTRHGQYGKYFEGKNNLNWDNNLVALELEALKEKKTLQSVVLLQLISQLQRECFQGDKSIPKVIIIDEAWELLANDPIVAEFMEGAYRKFRKYKASIVIICQSLADLYRSPAGEAISANSNSTLILNQKADQINSLKNLERVNLGDYGFELLHSVHTVKGVYSEILVHTGNGWGIGRLIVPEFAKMLYSSDDEDVVAIENRVASGMNHKEAINDYILSKNKKAAA